MVQSQTIQLFIHRDKPLKVYNPSRKCIKILREIKVNLLFVFALFFNLRQVVPPRVFRFLPTQDNHRVCLDLEEEWKQAQLRHAGKHQHAEDKQLLPSRHYYM